MSWLASRGTHSAGQSAAFARWSLALTRCILWAFVALASVAGTATSQPRHATSRGSTLVSGTAHLSKREANDGDDVEWSYQLGPTHLYFARNGLALGGSMSLSRQTNDRGEFSFVGLGPAARYYFREPGAQILPYVGAAGLFGRTRASFKSVPSSDLDRTERSRMVDGFAGLLFMPSRQVGVALELFHQRSSTKVPEFGEHRVAVRETGARVAFNAFLIP